MGKVSLSMADDLSDLCHGTSNDTELINVDRWVQSEC
jgi:hypothetical protein